MKEEDKKKIEELCENNNLRSIQKQGYYTIIYLVDKDAPEEFQTFNDLEIE